MRVWFYPTDKPGIYAVDRSDPDNPVIIISDGLPVPQVLAATRCLLTVEERDWVRTHEGAPTVDEDPTYTYADRLTRGEPVWDKSMIPAGMRWGGKPRTGNHATGAALAWLGLAAAIVGAVAHQMNGDSGLFSQLPVM